MLGGTLSSGGSSGSGAGISRAPRDTSSSSSQDPDEDEHPPLLPRSASSRRNMNVRINSTTWTSSSTPAAADPALHLQEEHEPPDKPQLLPRTASKQTLPRKSSRDGDLQLPTTTSSASAAAATERRQNDAPNAAAAAGEDEENKAATGSSGSKMAGVVRRFLGAAGRARAGSKLMRASSNTTNNKNTNNNIYNKKKNTSMDWHQSLHLLIDGFSTDMLQHQRRRGRESRREVPVFTFDCQCWAGRTWCGTRRALRRFFGYEDDDGGEGDGRGAAVPMSHKGGGVST
eukprot:g15907.t1